AHLETGNPILLVTDDSLMHIYVHLDKFQPDEFYLLGHNAWEVLSAHGLGRLHVHYFTGGVAGFVVDETLPKAMFQSPPKQPTLATYAHEANIPVHAIGKVSE